jgi:hypothetical protein
MRAKRELPLELRWSDSRRGDPVPPAAAPRRDDRLLGCRLARHLFANVHGRGHEQLHREVREWRLLLLLQRFADVHVHDDIARLSVRLMLSSLGAPSLVAPHANRLPRQLV